MKEKYLMGFVIICTILFFGMLALIAYLHTQKNYYKEHYELLEEEIQN